MLIVIASYQLLCRMKLICDANQFQVKQQRRKRDTKMPQFVLRDECEMCCKERERQRAKDTTVTDILILSYIFLKQPDSSRRLSSKQETGNGQTTLTNTTLPATHLLAIPAKSARPRQQSNASIDIAFAQKYINFRKNKTVCESNQNTLPRRRRRRRRGARLVGNGNVVMVLI